MSEIETIEAEAPAPKKRTVADIKATNAHRKPHGVKPTRAELAAELAAATEEEMAPYAYPPGQEPAGQRWIAFLGYGDQHICHRAAGGVDLDWIKPYAGTYETTPEGALAFVQRAMGKAAASASTP